MEKIFISGSMRIKNINMKVEKRIRKIISSDFNILLGDANGVDTSIQEFLKNSEYKNVTVYCSGNVARNNIGKWQINKIATKYEEKTRKFFTAKDIAMADDCSYGLMIWDSKSTGTLSNVYELLLRKKTSVVFVNKNKNFYTISKLTDFEYLIALMSESSKIKAEKKLGLEKKIMNLRYEQIDLPYSNKVVNSNS